MITKETIATFRERQSKIVELNSAFEKRMEEIGSEFDERAQALRSEFELKKAEASKDLDEATSAYKADMKALFGVCDGERTNILDVVEIALRVARND